MRRFAMLALAVAAATGCASKTKVGDRSLLNFKEQSQQELGATTTTSTTAAPRGQSSGEVALNSPPTTARPATTVAPAKPVATTAKPAAAAITVAINGDNAATAFDPSQLKVRVGTVVTWVNHDSVARSVRSDDGHTLSSPTLAPGASWSYTAATAGTFNYHDGTRPYAVGTFQVIAR